MLINLRDSCQWTSFKSLTKTPFYITFLSGNKVSWSHQEYKGGGGKEMALGSILDILEVLHLGRLGMTLDHEEQEREK